MALAPRGVSAAGGPRGEPPGRVLGENASAGRERMDFADPHRRFFYELDWRTNPTAFYGSQYTPFKDHVDAGTRALQQRVLARAAGRPVAPLPPPMVAALSRIQMELYEEIWPGFAADREKLASIDAAFERFSTGQLKRDTREIANGVPNGASFFLFAEFAFAALEAPAVPARERQGWRSVLPSLVRTQALYLLAYRPPKPGPWTWADWHMDNFDAQRLPSGDALREARSRFEAALQALPGDDERVTWLSAQMAKSATEAFGRDLGG
jgi:hypothetical protein